VAPVAWRGVRDDDLGAWADALAAIEAVDRTGEIVDREDLAAQLRLSYFEADLDSRLGWVDGRVVAWGTVLCIPNDRNWRVMIAGAVVPEWRDRGLGSDLVAWQFERSRGVAAGRGESVPAWCELGASVEDEARAELFRMFDFAPTRYYPQMRRSLALPPPVPPLDGLTLARFEPEHDDAVRLVHNEAFIDHFAPMPLDAESWRTWVTGDRHFRPDLSFVVFDEDEIVGYAMNFVYPDEWEALGFREGWTHQLGVRRRWRRRGVASALLDATAAAFAGEGLHQATLEVDAESLTGAFALYERRGYVRGRTWVLWTRPLD
jgi:ribosomal protein S18 acetylase RimI-like enzyme